MKRFACACAVVVVVTACPTAPTSSFGTPCSSAADCGDALQCRSPKDDAGRRCVPPRGPVEPGESCANPFVVALGAGGPFVNPSDGVVVDEVVLFGAAIDDGDVCGRAGSVDVALRFTLPQAAGLTVSVDDRSVAVALRPAGCGADVVRFGCSDNVAADVDAGPLVVPQVEAGEWEIVLEGAPEDAGRPDERGVRVVVTTIDCPLGYLPLDDDECAGFRAMQPLLRARGDAGAGPADDEGRRAVIGGIGRDGFPRADGEIFDPRVESFSFVGPFTSRVAPKIASRGDSVFVIGGQQAVGVGSVFAFDLREGLSGEPVRPDVVVRDVALTRDPIVLTDVGTFVVELVEARKSCVGGRFCQDGAVCIDDVCVCTGDQCEQVFRPEVGGLVGAAYPDGARAVAVDDDAFFVSTGIPSEPYRLVQSLNGGFVEGAFFDAAARRAPSLTRADRFVYVVGGVDVATNTPSDLIEEFDLGAQSVREVGRLRAPRTGHQAVLLRDRYLAIIGQSDRDDASDDVSDDVELFDTAALRLVRLPPLGVARRGAAVIDDRDGALIAGGFDVDGAALDDVERLEFLPRQGAQRQPPDRCTARPVVVGEVLVGTTGLALDRFRDNVCTDSGGAIGDEHWALQITEPNSVHIEVRATDFDLTPMQVAVTTELCAETEGGGACAVDVPDDPLDGLFLPRLEPGTYFVAVETVLLGFFPDLDLLAGRPYTMEVTLGPPEACTDDAADPDDDDPLSARALAPRDFGDAVAEGSLCDDDADHVTFEWFGGAVSDVSIFELREDLVSAAPVVVDLVASQAAGRIVASGVGAFGPVRRLPAQPAGVYVARVGPIAGLLGPVPWGIVVDHRCAPDAGDSLLAALDDSASLAGLVPLEYGAEVERQLCHDDDVDVLLLAPAGSSFVRIEPGAVIATLFEIDGDRLGAPIDAAANVDDDRVVLEIPARSDPMALQLRLPPGTGFAEASVIFDVGADGDACDEAVPLPGRTGRLSGSSRAFSDDHDVERLGDCTTFQSPGEDRVLSVVLATNETLNATLRPLDGSDVSIYVLSRCPVNPDEDVCVAGNDDASGGQPDSISFRNTGAASTFFVVVDSFSSSTYEYELTWNITP